MTAHRITAHLQRSV